MLEHWTIDSNTTYLNHGTVGVVPRRVLAAQQAIRDEMERQPARFMLRQVSHLVGAPTDEPTLVRRAAGAVASFLGAEGDDLVFVDNATRKPVAIPDKIRAALTALRSSAPKGQP